MAFAPGRQNIFLSLFIFHGGYAIIRGKGRRGQGPRNGIGGNDEVHIAISGRLGSGKSTICKLLSAQHGFEVYSTGSIQREIALQKKISTLELNLLSAQDRGLDFMIDEAVARISAQRAREVMIFDSRMAWKFALHAFKVFVTVDPVVAADRVMRAARGAEELYADAEDARRQLIERAKLENARFQQIYGVDNFDYSNYHLVLDSSCAPPELLARMIYAKFTQYIEDTNDVADEPRNEILLSPTSLFPMKTIGPVYRELLSDFMAEQKYREPISIAVVDGYHYIVDGHYRALAALLNKEPFVQVRMAPLDAEDWLGQMGAGATAGFQAFEDAGAFRYASYPA